MNGVHLSLSVFNARGSPGKVVTSYGQVASRIIALKVPNSSMPRWQLRVEEDVQPSSGRAYLGVGIQFPNYILCPVLNVSSLRLPAVVEINSGKLVIVGNYNADAGKAPLLRCLDSLLKCTLGIRVISFSMLAIGLVWRLGQLNLTSVPVGALFPLPVDPLVNLT
jgi:hypothetical protein